MSRYNTPELSHLSGTEVVKVAAKLASANLEVLLENRDKILELRTEDLNKLVELASATRSNCGGFGCG